MKKIILTFLVPLFFLSNAFAVESDLRKNNINKQEVTIGETIQAPVLTNTGNTAKEVKKTSKLKTFFKKLNPFKKAQSDIGNYIIAFFLGLLLGIIGILIAFLIYLNHENRKRIMNFAWVGWLWWLAIFAIILL